MSALIPHNRKSVTVQHSNQQRGNWYPSSHLIVGFISKQKHCISFYSRMSWVQVVIVTQSAVIDFFLFLSGSFLPVCLCIKLQTQPLILILETMSAKRCLLITQPGPSEGNNWHSHSPLAPKCDSRCPVPYPRRNPIIGITDQVME